MFSRKWPYHNSLPLSFGILAACGVAAIALQQPWLAALPFAWVLWPVLYEIFIVQPDKLFYFIIFLLPLSTELNITPQLGLDFPDELLLMALTGTMIVKMISEPRWIPSSFFRHPLVQLLAVYMGWVLITCWFSAEPVLSIKFALAKSWYILPLVVLLQTSDDTEATLKRTGKLLLYPMLAVTALALLRHAAYGFSFEGIKKVLFPFFRNHVTYSSMLVCLMPVGWCAWQLSRDRKTKRWILAGMAVALTGLIFSYSRGAWVALAGGIFSSFIIRKRWMGIAICGAVLAILLSSAWLITDRHYMRFAPNHDKTIFHTDFSEHIVATVQLRDVSNAERFYRWVAGFRMLAERPLTGFGPNTFYLHYRPYTVASFATWVSDNPEHSTVHNYFILLALEQGIIGLGLFCVLYFGMLLYAQRLYHSVEGRFNQLVALTVGVVTTMIGIINSSSDLVETDKIGSLFWLCLGVLVLIGRSAEFRRSERTL